MFEKDLKKLPYKMDNLVDKFGDIIIDFVKLLERESPGEWKACVEETVRNNNVEKFKEMLLIPEVLDLEFLRKLCVKQDFRNALTSEEVHIQRGIIASRKIRVIYIKDEISLLNNNLENSKQELSELLRNLSSDMGNAHKIYKCKKEIKETINSINKLHDEIAKFSI